MQRVVLQGFEARLHLFLGQVKPEFDDQRAFVAEHFFQAFGAMDPLIQHRILEQAVDPALQHLAVPVTEKHPHPAFGREHPPIAPGGRSGQFFVGLLIEGTHFDQPGVHPLVEQLDRLALAGTFDAVDQYDHRKPALLPELVLGFEQGFAQNWNFAIKGFFVDRMTDFGRFEH
ncbi:hypothetical protein D3C71_1487870 [compost metagenome]